MLAQHFICAGAAHPGAATRARRLRRSIAHAMAIGLMAVPAPAPRAAAQQAAGAPSTFLVFLGGDRIGSEEVAVDRTAEGWTITSSGGIGAPLELALREARLRYTADWQPLEMRIDATVQNQPLTIHTVVNGASAVTTITQGGQTSERTDTLAPDTIFLPTPFWGPFVALAQKLRTLPAGSTLQAYAGGASVAIEVGASEEETIQTAAQLIQARRTATRLMAADTPLDVEVWADESGRLLRLSVPTQSLEVAREDIASVATRRVAISRPNDEAVRVPANGFNMEGTLSRPADSRPAARLPAVILVAGSGPEDRDETRYGVPIFGQLAGRLADAGFVVLRYDKRGVGQSGGRIESATLADYAEDVRAAVRFLRDRRDVDRDRIAAVGHGEGGSVALLAAARERRITALVLVAAVGVTGAELNLTQVMRNVERSTMTAEERQATVELQKQIQTAVLTGKGWDELPEEYRRRAEAPWFKSFLAFDPARVMRDVRQPILIVQPMLDKQVDPSNADILEKLARERRRGGPADVVRVPGVNHLLVPAMTGEVAEYATLQEKVVGDQVSTAIVGWLQTTFAARR